MSIDIPPRPSFGQPNIICEANSYTIVSTNQTITTNSDGSPINGTALAQALRYYGAAIEAANGEVVALVRADQDGIKVNDTNLHLNNVVNWGGAGPVRNIVIVGEDKNLKLRNSTSIFNNTGNMRFQNLTLTNNANVFCPFIVNSNSVVGLMRLFDINFMPS